MDNRWKYTNHGGVHAKYVSTCPYCGYVIDPMSGDLVKKGPQGWGHVACVNLKVHYLGTPVCGTESTGNTRFTLNWEEVTCKKCLAKENDPEVKKYREKYPKGVVQ